MLVPATYTLRPGLLGGLKPGLRAAFAALHAQNANASSTAAPAAQLAGTQRITVPLDREQLGALAKAEGGDTTGVHVEPPELRQAIAWELALRNLRHAQVLASSCCPAQSTDAVHPSCGIVQRSWP